MAGVLLEMGEMRMDGKTKGTLALLVCVVGCAASTTLNKLAMAAGLHPLWINALRMGIAVLIMLPFFFKGKQPFAPFRRLSRMDSGLTLLSGILLGIHFFTWVTALKYADSVIAATAWSTFCLMTVVGSSLILH